MRDGGRMKPSPILISLDSNEAGSRRATALARAVGGDPAYELQGFAELPVDMAVSIGETWPGCSMQCGYGIGFRPSEHADECNACSCLHSEDRRVYIGLKEIPDFWASKSSGHLGQQILEMVSQGQPGFVAVFGSLQEVLQAVPTRKPIENPSGCRKSQLRSQTDIQDDLNTARAFASDATACGVPVFFLCKDHLLAFPWILSLAKNILTGPNMASWLPRFPVEPRGYGVLCAIPGVGDVAATGLLRYFGSVGRIFQVARENPELLASCPISNGGKLGKAKAAKIREVLG